MVSPQFCHSSDKSNEISPAAEIEFPGNFRLVLCFLSHHYVGDESECKFFHVGTLTSVVSPCLVEVTHLALGLSVGTSALIAALLLAVSGVMISKYGGGSVLPPPVSLKLFVFILFRPLQCQFSVFLLFCLHTHRQVGEHRGYLSV